MCLMHFSVFFLFFFLNLTIFWWPVCVALLGLQGSMFFIFLRMMIPQ